MQSQCKAGTRPAAPTAASLTRSLARSLACTPLAGSGSSSATANLRSSSLPARVQGGQIQGGWAHRMVESRGATAMSALLRVPVKRREQ